VLRSDWYRKNQHEEVIETTMVSPNSGARVTHGAAAAIVLSSGTLSQRTARLNSAIVVEGEEDMERFFDQWWNIVKFNTLSPFTDPFNLGGHYSDVRAVKHYDREWARLTGTEWRPLSERQAEDIAHNIEPERSKKGGSCPMDAVRKSVGNLPILAELYAELVGEVNPQFGKPGFP